MGANAADGSEGGGAPLEVSKSGSYLRMFTQSFVLQVAVYGMPDASSESHNLWQFLVD